MAVCGLLAQTADGGSSGWIRKAVTLRVEANHDAALLSDKIAPKE
jgi:hypothetical protein